MQLIQTINNSPYSSVHPKYKTTEGDIVDVGCLTWDWSNMFLGEKRVIGIDPQEKYIPEGAELFKGILGVFDGLARIEETGIGAGVSNNGLGQWYDVLSWKSFCKQYNINKISILKLNIEGSEYPVLASMDKYDFDKIDQIAVSFHDWLWPEQKQQTQASIKLLESHGFTVIQTQELWGWWLAFKQ